MTGPQRLAIAANSGIVATALLTGGLGAEVFQLIALHLLDLAPAGVGLVLLAQVTSIPVHLYAAGASLYTPNRVLLRRGHLGLATVVIALMLSPVVAEHDRRGGITVLLLAVVVGSCAASYGWGTAWHPWMQSLTTPADRSRVLGHMRFTARACGVLFLLLATVLATPRLTLGRFWFLCLLILAYLALALVLQSRLPDPTERARTAVAGSDRRMPTMAGLRAATRQLWGVSRLRRLALTVVLTHLLSTPLVLTYLVVVTKMPVAVVGAALAVRQVVAVTALLAWGRFLASRSNVSVIRGCLGLYAAICALWLVVLPGSGRQPLVIAMTCGLMIAMGALVSGVNLAVTNETYRQIPVAVAGVAFSLVGIIESTTLSVLQGVGGVLVELSDLVTLAGGLVDPYRLFLVIAPVLALLSAYRLERSDRVPAGP